MKRKLSASLIVRRVIQVAMFLLWPGLFLSIFAAIKGIISSLAAGTFSFPVYASQIFLLLAVLPLTALFGRFFCGFLCSFGSLGDAVWFFSRKTIKKHIEIPVRTEKVLKRLKYGLLIFLLVFVWILAWVEIPSNVDPWNIFGLYASFFNWPAASGLISVGGALLLVILVGSFFVERFFCRYLCPLGAVFALISRFRIFRIKKPRESCGTCKACSMHCPMGLPLRQEDTVKSGECIDCFACVNICPRKNVSTTVAGQETSPLAAGAVAAAAITGLSYLGTWAGGQIAAAQGVQSGENLVQSSAGQYADGTYTGTGSGFRGEIEVQVVVENGYITTIEVISYRDDSQYFNLAKNSVIAQILDQQTTQVSAVSGATFSSNGIMKAVSDALANQSISSVEGSGSGSKDSSSQPEQSQANDSSQPESSSDPLSESYPDGTYTGTGTGFRGNTQITVTVENGEITTITVDSYQDDERFFSAAQNTVIEEIINQQTVNVQTVSGATFSSNGIIEAVADALNIEFSNPNETMQRGHGRH